MLCPSSPSTFEMQVWLTGPDQIEMDSDRCQRHCGRCCVCQTRTQKIQCSEGPSRTLQQGLEWKQEAGRCWPQVFAAFQIQNPVFIGIEQRSLNKDDACFQLPRDKEIREGLPCSSSWLFFFELGMHLGLWSCFAHALPLNGTLGKCQAVKDAYSSNLAL